MVVVRNTQSNNFGYARQKNQALLNFLHILTQRKLVTNQLDCNQVHLTVKHCKLLLQHGVSQFICTKLLPEISLIHTFCNTFVATLTPSSYVMRDGRYYSTPTYFVYSSIVYSNFTVIDFSAQKAQCSAVNHDYMDRHLLESFAKSFLDSSYHFPMTPHPFVPPPHFSNPVVPIQVPIPIPLPKTVQGALQSLSNLDIKT